MRTHAQRLLIPALLGLLTIGCGKGPSLAPVSGTVTLGGKPVDGIRVTFEPIVCESDVTNEEVLSSFGITGDDGRYEMRTEVADA